MSNQSEWKSNLEKTREEIRARFPPPKFKKTDGLTPQRTKEICKSYSLRAPYQIELRPNDEIQLNLGISCDHAMMAYEDPDVKEKLISVKGLGFIPPWTEVRLTLKNEGSRNEVIDVGESVCRIGVIRFLEAE